MEVPQLSQLMFSIDINGSVIHTIIDPSILAQFWTSLAIQIIPGNAVVGIPGATFRILDEGGKHYIAHKYASAVGEAMVKFVIDGSGTHPDRYFLGRAAFFRPENIVASTGDLDVWVPPGFPVQETLMSSVTTEVSANSLRRNARGGGVKVPRPPNAYILYRRDHHKAVKQSNSKLSNNDICRQWNEEADEIRDYYHKMAVDIKRQVEALHPTYKYNPRKSSEIRRRARSNNGVYSVSNSASETTDSPDTSDATSMPTPPLDFETASMGSPLSDL